MSQRLKTDRQRKSRKGPIPDALIRSQRPNENVEWCANCQAHTRRTYDLGSTGSLWEAWGRAVSSSSGNSGYTWKGARCSHCYSTILWNVPAEIRKVTYGCGGCGLFLVVGIVSCFGWAGAFAQDFENASLIITIITLPILLPVFWFIYLHSCWIKWLHRQRVPAAVVKSTSTAPQKFDPSEMSVADMLAAARDDVSGKSEATAAVVDESTSTASQKLDSSEMSIADMLAAARTQVSGKSEATTPPVVEPTSTASQKLDPSEMSIEDMLAVARDEVSGKSKATAPPVDDASSTDEAESFEAAKPDTPQVDRDSMAIDEILAHCRKVDG